MGSATPWCSLANLQLGWLCWWLIGAGPYIYIYMYMCVWNISGCDPPWYAVTYNATTLGRTEDRLSPHDILQGKWRSLLRSFVQVLKHVRMIQSLVNRRDALKKTYKSTYMWRLHIHIVNLNPNKSSGIKPHVFLYALSFSRLGIFKAWICAVVQTYHLYQTMLHRHIYWCWQIGPKMSSYWIIFTQT